MQLDFGMASWNMLDKNAVISNDDFFYMKPKTVVCYDNLGPNIQDYKSVFNTNIYKNCDIFNTSFA